MKTMQSKRHLPATFASDLVWAAAAAAFRINGGYNKVPVIDDHGKMTAPTNREVMTILLYDTEQIQPQDYEAGSQCRDYLGKRLTMAGLRGELSEFDRTTSRIVALDEISSGYDLAVIASLPKSYQKHTAKDQLKLRLAKCNDAFLGAVGQRVETLAQVADTVYSHRFNTYYITAISADNCAMFFAFRQALDVGQPIQLKGTVKRHGDRITQLSRVKLELKGQS